MAETTTLRPTNILNTIVHTELASTDPAATRSFFQKTFHWSFEDMPMPAGTQPYTNIKDGQGKDLGGLRSVAPSEPGPVVANYIGVDDIEATARMIEKNGGKVTVPIQTIPDMGKMLWFQAPGGNTMACWQDLSPARRS